MNNTDKIRELLQRRINAAKYKAEKTDDYIIPLEDRWLIRMSIKEVKAILAILPCETCEGLSQIVVPRKDTPGVDWELCPDCKKEKLPIEHKPPCILVPCCDCSISDDCVDERKIV